MRKLPPLATLRAFEAAARRLSFKQAAEELGVTPTAISHQVRLLEDHCGQQLFRRTPRPLALTKQGARLFPVLRTGLDAFAEAFGSLTETAEHGRLRVTTPNAFASRWLVPRLPNWRDEHPGIALEVIGADEVLDLKSGDADVAIRYASAKPAGLAAHELLRDHFFPVCSPALLPEGFPLPRAADLLRFPLIHFDWLKSEDGVPNWRAWWAAARSNEPDLPEMGEAVLSFREESHAIDAVIAGEGIAICSDVVLGRELETGVLVKARLFSIPGYGFCVAHLADHPKLQWIAAFARSISSVAEGGGNSRR